MRIFILLYIIGTSNLFFAQKKDSLILKKTFSEKLFHESDKKNMIVLDAELGYPYLHYGLNYFYQIHPKIRFGIRSGWNSYISKQLYYGDRIIDLKIEMLGAYKLYKTVYAELGLGIYNNYVVEAKKWFTLNPCLHIGATASFFRYFFIRSSFQMSYDPEYKETYIYPWPSVSLGLLLKF